MFIQHGPVTYFSVYFADDFQKFAREDFAALPNSLRRELRDYLLKKDVYVRKGRSIQISNALYELVHTPASAPSQRSVSFAPDVTTISLQDNDGNNPTQERTSNRNAERHGYHTTSYSYITRNTKNISSLYRAYSGRSDCYNGSHADDLDGKLALFDERCEQAEVYRSSKLAAFSIMFEGAARSYYLAKVKGKCHTFEEAVALIRKRFITPERTRALVQEWEEMSLSEFLKADPTKPKQCLEDD